VASVGRKPVNQTKLGQVVLPKESAVRMMAAIIKLLGQGVANLPGMVVTLANAKRKKIYINAMVPLILVQPLTKAMNLKIVQMIIIAQMALVLPVPVPLVNTAALAPV